MGGRFLIPKTLCSSESHFVSEPPLSALPPCQAAARQVPRAKQEWFSLPSCTGVPGSCAVLTNKQTPLASLWRPPPQAGGVGEGAAAWSALF